MPAYQKTGFEEGWNFIVSWFRMSLMFFFKFLDANRYIDVCIHTHICKILTDPKGKVAGTISAQNRANWGTLPWIGINIIFWSYSLLCCSGCGLSLVHKRKPRYILSLLATRVFNVCLLRGCKVILQGIYTSLLFSFGVCTLSHNFWWELCYTPSALAMDPRNC